MTKRGRAAKRSSRKTEGKRAVKDLTAKRGRVEGGTPTKAGKLTFGEPAPRPAAVDPSDPS